MSENLTPSERNVSKAAAEKAAEREAAQKTSQKTSQAEPHTAPVPRVEGTAGAAEQETNISAAKAPEGVRVSPSASAKPTASKAEKKADKKAEKKATREAFARPQSIEEAAKPQNRAAFRAAVALYGLFMIAYGLWQVFGGVSAVPDAPTDFANSSVQSNYVFFASTYVGVGLSFVFIALKFKWVNMLAFSCLVVFLGGVGRILSWVNFGTPNWTLIVLMVTELVIPPCLLVWYGWINKSNAIRQEMLNASRTQPAAAAKGRK
ncbi:DUF4345 domain-containing protein [uncultured Rothia sp.]|uniref:DUF4345 domain-containing protein n=1 Tax=uncultured Rothia sp. TaxID=316088 RepID=UPI0028D5E862|nr:DUF4345 domain-containing protein [uncultured Rothia sp.]